MIAVIQEAWIGGVSTRRVDDLAQAMGLSGISKSPVSKLCKDIDEQVHAFLDRPLTGDWPYFMARGQGRPKRLKVVNPDLAFVAGNLCRLYDDDASVEHILDGLRAGGFD